MSSLSSSAIHLEGELVMGCEDTTKVSEQNPWKIYSLGLYITVGWAYLFIYLSSLLIKRATMNGTHIFVRCSKFCNSGHCIIDCRIIKIRKASTTIQKWVITQKQGECKLTLLWPQVWWRSVQLLKAQQRGLKIITWHNTKSMFAF